MMPRSVVLDAPISRPSIAMVPRFSRSRASSSASGMRAELTPVAVVPRAQVAHRVQRLAAERARRAAGRHDLLRALDEGPGGLRGEAHAEAIAVGGGLL